MSYIVRPTGVSDYGVLELGKSDNRKTCRVKIHYYDINEALDRIAEIVELGLAARLGVYICRLGDHYHIGNKRLTGKNRLKQHCVWCGNWIRPARLEKHIAKCNKGSLIGSL